ncbi:DUF2231 domain-containing protein [Georgenia satyanarayanai]|uniref:DUF2231 domain-containing protein n=1 Tax=Georgenia satyanarayanai TaxID=860221 RepID=UPI0012640011|nr:DUF2231 domain-containing protein [Georgenia satyanarayanai]
MTATDSLGARLAAVVEKDDRLDGLVSALSGPTQQLIASPGRRDLLLGKQLGHALHPILTDLPIGFWTSSVVLDLTVPGSHRAARRLVGLGVLAAVPTAVTGWAEWARTGKREDQRTGVVHAAANGAAAALFGGSWLARRSGRHGTGKVLSQLGSLALMGGGALGGHLAIGRKVGSTYS